MSGIKNLANILSISRVVSALLFMVVFLFADYPWVWLVLVIIYTHIELSDLFDGMIARSTNTTSDFGKLFDPIADIVSRLTVMFCLYKDYTWWPLVVLIMMREVSMCFIRMQALRVNVVLAAEWSGKVKAVCYTMTNSFALLALVLETLDLTSLQYYTVLSLARMPLLALSVVIAYFSMLRYISYLRQRMLYKED